MHPHRCWILSTANYHTHFNRPPFRASTPPFPAHHSVRRRPRSPLYPGTAYTECAAPIAHPPCAVPRHRTPHPALRVRRRNPLQRRAISHPSPSHSVQRTRILTPSSPPRCHRHHSCASCWHTISSILSPPSPHSTKHRRAFSIQRHHRHHATDSMNKPIGAQAHVLLGQMCFFAVKE